MIDDRIPLHRNRNETTPPEVVAMLTEQATELLPKYPTAAPLVANLPIHPLLEYLEGGNNPPLPAEAMIQAFLFKEIRGTREKAELVDHLDKNPRVGKLLGFERETLPSRYQCSRWWKSNASPRTKDRVKDNKTEDVSEKMRKRFYPLLFLKRKGWCKYDEADFFRLTG